MQNPDEWKTPAYRQSMIQRIDERIHQFRGPMSRNAAEMESHVFTKAKSKDEYVAYISKIMMFLRNSNAPVQNSLQIGTSQPSVCQGMGVQNHHQYQSKINLHIGSGINITSNLPQSSMGINPGQSINTQQVLQNKSNLKIIYSGANQFPKNNQAIVIDAIKDLKINEYVQAVGKLIGPQNIIFASKIPEGKVCLYLRMQELADRIAVTNSNIKIGSHSLTLRLLVPRAKQIIISNVCPIIPHSEIEKKLLERGVQPKSPITFLSAGINEPGYAHVMSFQRQMDVHPDDVKKLPESLQINYGGTVDWIYFSSEQITCSSCGEGGHLAKNCQSSNSSTANPQSETPLAEHSLNSVQSSSSSASNLKKEPICAPLESSLVLPSGSGVKRSFSTYSDTNDSHIWQNQSSKEKSSTDPPSPKLAALEQNEKPFTTSELISAKDYST